MNDLQAGTTETAFKFQVFEDSKDIALGQTYFAIQIRRQEVQDAFNQLDENNKRLVVRGNVKQ